jgi:hypothetical protein
VKEFMFSKGCVLNGTSCILACGKNTTEMSFKLKHTDHSIQFNPSRDTLQHKCVQVCYCDVRKSWTLGDYTHTSTHPGVRLLYPLSCILLPSYRTKGIYQSISEMIICLSRI